MKILVSKPIATMYFLNIKINLFLFVSMLMVHCKKLMLDYFMSLISF